MEKVAHREVKFIKQPKEGDFVKVYTKSTVNRFGIVTGVFTKKHITNYPPTISMIETAILTPCEEIPIEDCNYFLDENRVQFTDKKIK